MRAPTVDRAAALDELAELLRSRRSWKYIRIATGQIVDLRLRLIDQMSRTAAQALRMRERAKSALLTLGGEERRGIVEITARLIESHQIRTPEDVELLADRELAGMLLGAPSPPSADLHWRRAVARRTRRAPPLPDVFTGYPGVMPRAAVSGRVLAGWSASPGKAEAPARVVTDLADAVEMSPQAETLLRLVAEGDPRFAAALERRGELFPDDEDAVARTGDWAFTACLAPVHQLDLELCIQLAARMQAAVDAAGGLAVFTDDENGWLFHGIYLLCRLTVVSNEPRVRPCGKVWATGTGVLITHRLYLFAVRLFLQDYRTGHSTKHGI